MIVMKKKNDQKEEQREKESTLSEKEFSALLKEAMQDQAFGVPRPAEDFQRRLQMIPEQYPRTSRKRAWFFALFPAAGVAVVWVFLFFGQPPLGSLSLDPQKVTHGEPLQVLPTPLSPVVRPRPYPPIQRRAMSPPLPRQADVPSPLVAKGTLWEPLYAHQTQGKKTQRSHVLRDGAVLHPGDLVQWTYKSSALSYVFLVGMNQQGEIYPLLPRSPKQPALRLAQSQGSLPQVDGEVRAFRLDRYVGVERFFVFQADKSFSFEDVKRELLDAWEKSQQILEKMVLVSRFWSIYSVYFVKKVRED